MGHSGIDVQQQKCHPMMQSMTNDAKHAVLVTRDIFSKADHMTGAYDKHASGGPMQAMLE
jgi:hypothetical protein